jgi:hypothetical protein
MSFRSLLDRALGPNLKVVRCKDGQVPYHQDGLLSFHDHSFMEDPAFQAAYARGVRGGGADPRFHWRVHTAIWAGRHARHIAGDFVECGVNSGFMSAAIMQDLGWNGLDKTFWLADTFEGPVESQYSDVERAGGRAEQGRRALAAGGYGSLERVRENFAEWEGVRFVQGVVPESLERVEAAKVAYLHLDMNCVLPEVAAAEFFWPRLVPGGVVLMDDYAYRGYREQKVALDDFAAARGVSILALPTGQGLLIKLPSTD